MLPPDRDAESYQWREILVVGIMITLVGSLASAESANKSYRARGYSFQADNSYRGSDGACVQSALQILQVGNSLIIASTANGPAEIVTLSPQQMAEFSKLKNRAWGHPQIVRVKIENSKDILTFQGDSCGRMLCDSLSVQHADGNVEEFYQPIHGLTKIGCK